MTAQQQRSMVGLGPSATEDEIRGRLLTVAAHEVRRMELFLPPKVTHVVDIGAGLACADVLLGARYPSAVFTLIDGDGAGGDRVHGYGAADEMAHYGNTAAAKRLTDECGLPCAWRPIDCTWGPCGLLISLLSWGWHYPVSTYVKRAAETASVVIMDIRGKTDGEQTMRAAGFDLFGEIEHVNPEDAKRGRRLAFRNARL